MAGPCGETLVLTLYREQCVLTVPRDWETALSCTTSQSNQVGGIQISFLGIIILGVREIMVSLMC